MCGIILVAYHEHSPRVAVSLLQRLQHRGHQGVKIVYGDFERPYQCAAYGGMGKVDQIFDNVDFDAEKMQGQWCIGHTRYTTCSERISSRAEDCQPFVVESPLGKFVVAHNGQLGGSMYEIQAEKQILMGQNYNFHYESDTELLLGNIARLQNHFSETEIPQLLCRAVAETRGSASLVGSVVSRSNDVMFFGARKNGNRPLFYGFVDVPKDSSNTKKTFVISSEDYMLKSYGVSQSQEVPPGHLITYGHDGFRVTEIDPAHPVRQNLRHCLFELFYFSHPLSTFRGATISRLRKGFGARLADIHRDHVTTEKYDVVMGAPDSGNHAALGFSQQSNFPLEFGLVRNHYMGRSFICETRGERERRASNKYNVDESVVNGKNVIVVDDSLIRSITARVITRKLRRAGANKVAFLIASPPIRHSNYYGIDIIDDGSIAASNMSVEKLQEHLQIDYLGYLDMRAAKEVIARNINDEDAINNPTMFCTACFDGTYWH